MKIILLQKVENLGEKYDIKNVASGFARNFLIPRGLAKIADDSSIRQAEEAKAAKLRKAEASLKITQETVSKIDGREVVMPVKVGEKKQLFESVNSQNIVDQLQKMGFDIKEGQIILEKPIKELGEFPLKIQFDHNLEADIKVIVTEEKK